MVIAAPPNCFYPSAGPAQATSAIGFRLGAKGTHTSRTIMFDDLDALMRSTSARGGRKDYAEAIISMNCLGKSTVATRRLANQRLGELYALDPAVPLFRVFRRLWDLDAARRQLLALQCAIARDPLLAASAPAVLGLVPGAEFVREPMATALREAVGDRISESVLNKVVRNAASSWTQSGHLVGRTLKKRQRVTPSPASLAMALYLAHAAGFRGGEMLSSAWVAVLDCSPPLGRQLALEAKRIGLIDLRMAGEVFELNLDRLDPANSRN